MNFLAVPGGSDASAGGTGNATSNSPATGSAAAGNAITSGRVQISVHGSLDADEVKAIDDLLSQVESLANQFFAGDLQDAFGAAAALNADPGEIARFSLHLSYTQLGIGSLASAVPTGTGTGAATGSSPAPSGASAQQTIGSFIQSVLGKLASASGGPSFNFSMKWKLELLATALPSYAPTPLDAAAPPTQLASATVKSLAN